MENNEIMQDSRYFHRLIELSRDLASTLDLEDLLNKIVHAAADLSGAEAASILLFEETQSQLYFQAATNLDKPLMRGLIVPVDSSIAGWVIRNRNPLIIDDVTKDERHFGKIGKTTNVATQSILATPMITKNKVVGVLEAINKQEGSFSDVDKDILMTLSAQAAVAIENARLFQQSDLISEFVHELRTPLASLNTAAHLLLRKEIPQEHHDRMVSIIKSETRRLSDLATTFLDLSRMESGRQQFYITRFEIFGLLHECVSVVQADAEEKDRELILDIDTNLPMMEGDRSKIKQMLLNLLSNAIKYNDPLGKIWLAASMEGESVRISITDNGPGIPEEHLPFIFQKFYRVPGSDSYAQGTGLGLSIVKKIIDTHKGEIEIESKVGEGTTFTVFLPHI